MYKALKCPHCSGIKSSGNPQYSVETINYEHSIEYRVICTKCGNCVYRPRFDRKRLNSIYNSSRPLMDESIQKEIYELLKCHGKKINKGRFFAMYLERDPEFSEYLECEYEYFPGTEGNDYELSTPEPAACYGRY